MPSKSIHVLFVFLLVLSLLGGACAAKKPLEKKAATSVGKTGTEGQLEAIPPPVSQKKQAVTPAEPSAQYVPQEVPAKVEESNVASGYRVQIFASSSLEKADEIAAKARGLFTEKVYVEYSAPLYRVRIGNFAAKEAALQFRDKVVQSGFEGAWVAEALIERE